MNILSNFPERLSELMDEKNLKAKDLALKIGISRNTVTRYLQGVRLPSYQNFIKIIGVLDCSADFLLGTEDFNPLNGSFKMPPPFCDRFRRLLEERKISQAILVSIFPLVSLFLALSFGIANPRFKSNMSYFYVIGATTLYFVMVHIASEHFPFLGVVCIPMLWLLLSYWLYAKTIKRYY